MTADPLADVLADLFGWPADGWESVARAAREHIAAEIEADDVTEYGPDERAAMQWAARIARGQA